MGAEGTCGGAASRGRVCGRGAQRERLWSGIPGATPRTVPPGPLTPVQELRHVALPPQGGAAELVVQPQQQIQEAVEPRAAAGLAPHQPLQRAQPPLHGCGRSPEPGLKSGRPHARPSVRPSVGPRVGRRVFPPPSRPPRCHLPLLPPARPHLGAAPRPPPRPPTDGTGVRRPMGSATGGEGARGRGQLRARKWGGGPRRVTPGRGGARRGASHRGPDGSRGSLVALDSALPGPSLALILGGGCPGHCSFPRPLGQGLPLPQRGERGWGCLRPRSRMGVVVRSLPGMPAAQHLPPKNWLVSHSFCLHSYRRPGRRGDEAEMVTSIWQMDTLRLGKDEGELGGWVEGSPAARVAWSWAGNSTTGRTCACLELEGQGEVEAGLEEVGEGRD